MQYVQVGCPVCHTGVIGVRRCSDGLAMVLMCDECETVWTSPEEIAISNALDAEPPEFLVSGLDVAIAGGAAGWATEGEVAHKGWSAFVKGTQPD